EAEIEQLVDLTPRLPGTLCCALQEHVLAGDPKVGGAGLDVGGDVGGTHGDDADLLEEQLALVRAQPVDVESEALEQLDCVLEQRAAGHRDREAVHGRHQASSPPASPLARRAGMAMSAPAPVSAAALRPSLRPLLLALAGPTLAARSPRTSSAPVPRSSPARAMCSRSTPSAKPTAGRPRPKRASSSS